MRYLLAVIMAVMLFSTSAQAEDFDHNKFCIHMSKMAKSTMALRQYGKPIVEIIEDNNKHVKEDWLREALLIYAKEAYARPLRLSDEAKEMEINEFASEKYLLCMSAYE